MAATDLNTVRSTIEARLATELEQVQQYPLFSIICPLTQL